MTNTAISALPAATTASGTDVVPVVQGGVTKKLPLSLLLAASDAPEVIRDTMGAALVAGSNVTITVNDAGDTITIAAAGGAGAPADATTGTKGIVQLAGDLAGTAAAPTVPGLAGKLTAASNLADLASAATARTNLGLGSAATQSSTAFDAAGAAAAAQAAAVQRANHSGTQAASTITGLAAVATSGVYSDLTGKPVIPSAADFLPANAGVASGMFVVTDAAYGAKGDGTTDDTAAIQAAITAAQAVHGTVYLPRGLYKTTAALTVSAGIQIVGEGCVPLYGSIATDFNTINVPVAAPYLAGAVIMPSTAGQNAITITGAGISCNMSGFGIRFADTIKFTNTGHGIYYSPGVVPTKTYLDNGLTDSEWKRITVFGHDGNHYAFYLVNPIYNSLRDLRAFGGGVLYVENAGGTNPAQNYGNMLVDHIYGQVFLAGTADGIRLKITSATLNLMQFNKPQITCAPMTTTFAGTTGPSNTTGQKMINADQFVKRLTIISPDFETNSNCTVQFPSPNASQFIAPGLINFGSGSTSYVAMSMENNKQLSQDLGLQDGGAGSGVRAIHTIAGVGSTIAVDTATSQAQFGGSIKPKGYATGSRPSAATLGAGAQVFDTTLNKPIWSTGTAWVDASGATV